MAGSESQLGELHGILTAALAAELKTQAAKGELNPAFVGQVIKFLKDNNIQATDEDPAMKALKATYGKSLQDFPFDPAAAN